MISVEIIAAQLGALLACERQGLAYHAHGSEPHAVGAAGYRMLDLIRRCSATAADHTQRIVRIAEMRRVTPHTIARDHRLAHYHYLDVENLLLLLIDEKRQQVRLYEKALEALSGDPSLVAKLTPLLDENRRLEDEMKQACSQLCN